MIRKRIDPVKTYRYSCKLIKDVEGVEGAIGIGTYIIAIILHPVKTYRLSCELIEAAEEEDFDVYTSIIVEHCKGFINLIKTGKAE